VLRVGLPPAAGIEMVLADAYLTAWPEVELEFVSGHGQLDLLGSGIDVALWVGPVPDERLIGRKLASFQSLVYAAPRLIERLGMPTLTTLADYPCVLGFDSVGRPERSWPLWAGGTTPVQGRMRSNSMPGRIDGARMGLGLTMASERFVRDQVAAGELVPVLTDVVGRMTTVRLVWQPSAFLDPKIRAFVDLSVQVVERMVKARDAAAPPSC
jgi:DNA-binding transcriptional LysR family regulator